MLPTKFLFTLSKRYQRRRLKCDVNRQWTPSDSKSFHCLWQGKLNRSHAMVQSTSCIIVIMSIFQNSGQNFWFCVFFLRTMVSVNPWNLLECQPLKPPRMQLVVCTIAWLLLSLPCQRQWKLLLSLGVHCLLTSHFNLRLWYRLDKVNRNFVGSI
jgi:hypothetical protein